MKVLHLISGGDTGGAKSHVFTLLSVLKEEIDVNIVCFTEGVFFKEIQKMTIPSMLFKQRYRNDLSIVKKLVNHIRLEKYDIIHSHGARANFICLFLKPFIKIPIITSIHSDYKKDFTKNIYKKIVFTQLNTKSLKYFDYYIAVSENFKEMLCERNFQRDKIYTVYNAIDFDEKVTFRDKEEFLKDYNINYKGKKLIGIIGRFDKVKGHDVFLKAAAKLLNKNNNILFLLAGEGDEKNNLLKLCKNLGISNNIIFLGFVDKVYDFINAIDINVLSSHSESFPYVLLEGAKMCKPTVSTNVGGIPDLIKYGHTGLLCRPNSPEDLAEKLQTLLDDNILAEELGTNLNIYAKSNFSKDSLRVSHIEIYNNIIKRQKAENKLFDIMLSGYYGFNNSGDDALLGAIINSLRANNKDISLIVLSKNPKETAQTHNVYSIKRNVYNFLEIMNNLKRSKVFLNGGGSLIQDITSSNSLRYYTTLMKFAKKYGLYVLLYGNGIGPIVKKKNEKMAVDALNRCDIITLRDPESFFEIDRLKVKPKRVILSADPAFVIKPVKAEYLAKILTEENINLNEKFFVVSVRNWKYNDNNFVIKIAKAINEINESLNLVPLFIPMQRPFDEVISREIIGFLKCKYFMLKSGYSVMELMSIIGKAEFVIGMRLHTLIYAVRMGIPIIGIVYDPKIKAFMEYVNQSYYVECSDIDYKAIVDLTKVVYSNKDNIIDELFLISRRFEKLSFEDAKITLGLLSTKVN